MSHDRTVEEERFLEDYRRRFYAAIHNDVNDCKALIGELLEKHDWSITKTERCFDELFNMMNSNVNFFVFRSPSGAGVSVHVNVITSCYVQISSIKQEV